MTSDRDNLVEQIVREAMARDVGDRPAFLDAACGDDDALRAEVASRVVWDDEKEDDRTADVGAPTAALPAPSRDPIIGRRIAHYHVKRVIASGGMGTVYLATQEQPRRTVAVKLMKAGVVSRDALRRFEFEAQVLARLRHPGIAQVYDAGTHDNGSGGVPYFAMEYVPNARPLTDYARTASLTTDARLELFAKVCDAVHHGHQKGIIHRDLKPSNVLVDADGHPKVIDFGVARATDSDMALTTLQTDVGQLVGTVQYMSPEQVDADPHNIDIRSDVYALGVMLYELLTERLPYDVHDKPIYEAVRVVREATPTRPMSRTGPLERDLETIVLKALEKDRARRYQSADELRHDVLRLIAGEAITARPPSVAYQVRVFARKNKALVAGAVVLLVVLVAGTIGTTAGMIRATRGMKRAVVAEEIAQREADRAAAVRDFLKRMLASANPFLPSRSSRAALQGEFTTFAGSAGRDVAAVDLLLQAAETLERSFDDTPEIKAELRHTLGETLLGLGQLTEARTQLDLAVALRRQVLGPDHVDTARSRARLAELLVWQGSSDRAERVYAEAHAALEASLGPAHPETMAVAGRRAGALLHRGKLGEAVDLQTRTLDQATAVLGTDDPATFEQMVHLGFLYWTKSEFDRAIELGRRAVEGLARLDGEDAQSTALARDVLAGALRSAGQADEAREHGEAALRAMRRNVGNEHPDTLSCMRNLANVCLLLGDYEAANPLYREVLAAQRRLLPPTHEERLLTLNDFAAALAFQGTDLEDAEVYAQESHAGLAKIYGPQTQYALNAADTLAMVLRRRGKTERAIEVYEGILEAAARRDIQISVPITARVGLAECHIDLGAYENAEAQLRIAADLSGATDDPAQLTAWRISPAFVELYDAWGRDVKAEEWRRLVIVD